MGNQLIQLFETFVQRVNNKAEHREFVRDWIGPYDGKVLQLETDEGTFHLVLQNKGTITLKEGSYPSPDVIYKAKTQTLMNLFSGQVAFRDSMKSWDLIVIGAGHESVPLTKLMLQVLQSS